MSSLSLIVPRPPIATRTDTLCPHTTLFRSMAGRLKLTRDRLQHRQIVDDGCSRLEYVPYVLHSQAAFASLPAAPSAAAARPSSGSCCSTAPWATAAAGAS